MQTFKVLTICLLTCGWMIGSQIQAQEVEWASNESRVGVGIGTPAVKLHVFGDSVEPGSTADPVEELLRLESIVAPVQTFVNSTSGAKWYFAMVSNDDFKVSFDGTGRVEARFKPNGDLRLRGTVYSNSDRDSKTNIARADSLEILRKLVSLPISTWEYKGDTGVRHIGPMAQDFYAEFGLGASPTGISTIDAGGVALAAVQGLYAELESAQAENMSLKKRIERQEARMAQLEIALSNLLYSDNSDLTKLVE